MDDLQLQKDWLMKLLIDSETPINTQLSAKYKRSFAYPSMKDRAPVVLTKVVDYLVRDKAGIEKRYGSESLEEIKCAIGELSQLKNHLQTSKPFESFISNDPDTVFWNEHLKSREDNNEINNYYESDWLFAECYLYRRIREIFATKRLINTIDPFSAQKTQVLISALETLNPLFKYIHETNLMDKTKVLPMKTISLEIVHLLKWCLWANRTDLSFTAGKDNTSTGQLYQNIDLFDDHIVVDDSHHICALFTVPDNSNKTVDIIMDNGGLEMLCDMTFADFLISRCGVRKINFHIKPIPWYVSDVIKRDFCQGVDSVASSSMPHYKEIGLRWKKYMDTGLWNLYADTFWCLGLPFHSMADTDPSLYKRLSESSLIIFKGDLNYRKLVRDINWEPSTSFESVLDNFRPAPILAIRTLKADTVCGIDQKKAENLKEKEPDWCVNGNYGMIQFCNS